MFKRFKSIGRTVINSPKDTLINPHMWTSSRSVSGFFGPFRPENPETDWDDPGVSSRSVSEFFDQNRKKSPGPKKHPEWLLLQKEFNSGIRGAIYSLFSLNNEEKTGNGPG